jgi:hypothetical protein
MPYLSGYICISYYKMKVFSYFYIFSIFFFLTTLLGLDAYANNSNHLPIDNASLIMDNHQLSIINHQLYVNPDTVIPRVFIKGQYEKLEEILNQQFPKQLLYAYSDNTQNAFSAWAKMVWEMQKFGESTGFDVKGLKAFATFYYDKKGNIRHIAYSLKGTSRYFKPEELDKFFKQFMAFYKLPDIKTKFNFQHEFTLSLPYPRLTERQ